MARNGTPLPRGRWWRRLRARLSSRPERAEADARFFEGANAASAAWRPRPDSPEVSIFTPEEEAESHARWRRAVLHRKFRGPVSGAERVGFGLSAAGLAATLTPEREPDAGTDARAETAAQEDGEALLARKAAALGQSDKAPITSKPVASTQAFTDSGGVETALSTAMSSRADSGAPAARRAAPRSSGSPLEGRVGGGGADRAEVAVHRKAEASPGEARAPSPVDGAVAFRGIAPAEIASVAIALDFVLPDARDERGGADAEPAPGGARADAHRGAPPSEAERSGRDRADGEPAAAQAETAGGARQGPVADARGRDGCADTPAAAAEGRTADAGRGTAEAPGAGRGKGVEAAATAAKAEPGPEEHDEAEAPVEAKAKDVASEAGSGLGGKAARSQAKAVEVEVSEAKTAGPERGAGEGASAAAPGAKAKEASPSVESKTEPARAVSEAPERVAARNVPVVGEVAPDKALMVAVSSKTKAAEGLLADARADGRQGSPTTVDAKGDAAISGTKDAGGAVLSKAMAAQDAATTTASKVEAVAAQTQPSAQGKVIDLLSLAADTKPGQHPGDAAQAPTGGKGAKDLPSTAVKAEAAATQGGTAPDANTKAIAAVEAAKASSGAAPADAAGQATAKGVPAAEGAKPVVGAALTNLIGQNTAKVEAAPAPADAKGATPAEGAKSVIGAVLADLGGQDSASATPAAVSKANGGPTVESAKPVVGAAVGDLLGQGAAKAETGATSPPVSDVKHVSTGDAPKPVVGAALADLLGQGKAKADAGATPAPVPDAKNAPAVDGAAPVTSATLAESHAQGTTKVASNLALALPPEAKGITAVEGAKVDAAAVLDAKGAPAVEAIKAPAAIAPADALNKGTPKTEAAPAADHAAGQAKLAEAPASTAEAAQSPTSIPTNVAAVDAAALLARPAEAVPPAPEALTLHVADLWPGAGEAKAAPLVLDTTGMAVKNTEPVKAILPAVAEPTPSGAEVLGVSTPKAVDKAQPATPPDAAPLLTGATKGDGAVSPVEKSGEAIPSPAKVVPPTGTEGTTAATKPALAPEDAGGASGTPGSVSKAPGIVLTRSADDALGAFAPQSDGSVLARPVDGAAATGKASVPDHGPSVAVPILDSFLQPVASSDHLLL